MSLVTQKPVSSARGRLELTRWPVVRALLRQRLLNWALMTLALFGFAAAVLAGLVGTAVGSANFGIVFVWIVWWGLFMCVLLPLGGRVWCLICPIPAPGEWVQRGALVRPPAAGGNGIPLAVSAPGRRTNGVPFTLGWRWPARLQGIWFQNFGFLGVALFSTVILTQPWITGWALLGFLVGALGLALLFERRAFCRYVCPVGGFIGLYSLVAPLELRVKDPEVCHNHLTKECYLGSASGYGCPWLEQPWRMDRNVYCGLCGECLRTCPKDNVAVSLRLPGTDLLVAHGWRLDEAYKAFIMLACAAIYPVVLLGPWGWLKSWADLAWLPGFGLYSAAFLALNLVGVPSAHLGIAALVRRAAALREVSLRQLFVALAYPLVPLGLVAWLAFTLSFVFANLSYVLPVLSDPLGWGWNLLGTGDLAWRPWLAGWIPWLQASVLIVGLMMSIVTSDAILRALTRGRATVHGLAVQAAALTVETLFFLWLYLGASA
jgi:ferredoxin